MFTNLFHYFNVKFIYSEKATTFCEISTLLLSYLVPVKSKMEISQNFLAFSEYIINEYTRSTLQQLSEYTRLVGTYLRPFTRIFQFQQLKKKSQQINFSYCLRILKNGKKKFSHTFDEKCSQLILTFLYFFHKVFPILSSMSKVP